MADPGIEPGQAPLRIGVGRKVHLRQVCRGPSGRPPQAFLRTVFAADDEKKNVSVIPRLSAHE